MAFQLSPGVLVTEKDLTTIVPAVATTSGGFAGAFQWGPVEEVTTVASENELVQIFGKPNDTVYASFFTAANFLSYGNNLQVIRAADASIARNAVAQSGNAVSSVLITDTGAGYNAAAQSNTTLVATTTGASQPTTNATFTATYTGSALTGITLVQGGNGYDAAAIANTTLVIATTGASQPSTNATATLSFQSASSLIIQNTDKYENNYSLGQGTHGQWAAKYPGALGNSLKVSVADGNTYTGWTYETSFDGAPGTSSSVSGVSGAHDEMHIIVVDEDGLFTGTPGTVLEKFAYVSKASNATKSDGSSAYYKSVINNQSKYIWWMDHPTIGTNWGTAAAGVTFANLAATATVSLVGGISGDEPTDGNVQSAYAIFANDEKYDVALLPLGDVTATTAAYVINNVAEIRKDCVVFVSPLLTDVNNVTNESTAVGNVTDFRDLLPSSSYAVMDSGWKYQYDRYNDKYRWVPLNGDTAGLAVRTDFVADPWFSPAGFNRGQIKNVVKLALTPSKTSRDTLYRKGVNPVVTFPGQGTVLYGDKTLLSKPSAFDRINVRRLFIVLEKAIATAAKYQLFEFNDAITRAQFRNLVEPFLRDVQGRRGITDFKVVCDETNNTGEVIDRNEFIADIYIKPNRSINFIQLNFIATRTGISFDEVGA